MKIVLVGGHDRMHCEYKNIGDRYGHTIKVFTQLPPRFDKTIGVPDAIVVFTSTVSHKMVHTAVKEAKKKSIPVVRCHTSSASSLEETIKQIQSYVC